MTGGAWYIWPTRTARPKGKSFPDAFFIFMFIKFHFINSGYKAKDSLKSLIPVPVKNPMERKLESNFQFKMCEENPGELFQGKPMQSGSD